MNSKIHVLIPDGDSTWALSVLSCLSYNPDYKFFVLSNTKRTATKYSRYTAYYKYYKRTSDQDWLEILNKEIEANDISVIVPIAEIEMQFFITYQNLLNESAKLIFLPNMEAFQTAIHKNKLSYFIKEHQLPHPKFVDFNSVEAFKKSSFSLSFPVLMKPLHDKGGDGILRFDSLNSLNTYLDKIADSEHVFIQEYIEGYDIDCSVICLKGEVLAYTIQKGNLLGHSPFAPQLGFNFTNNDKVIRLVRELMQKLDWSGVAHIDLRYDKKEEDYKVIEINARFWGSVDGSRVAGINFPELAIKLAMQGSIEKTSFRTIHYMRLKGVLKSIKRKPSFIFKRKYLLNNTETKSFLRDPLPTVCRFFEWFSRLFQLVFMVGLV
ncbi:ATP-grasp domain-containing protein [Psychroserpens sp. XS_ASV72]|uniref:ATP-grasp domain-containing protein n=1 Tax=Psychroserpens sp. XS_ASV72 TaxID=3241293 RepID=UPI00351589C6